MSYVIKNGDNKYYVNEIKYSWTTFQSNALRFASKAEAKILAKKIKSGFCSPRVVKLKSCQELYQSKQKEPINQFDAQTFLAKIDKYLLEGNVTSVTINFNNYQELFMADMNKISHRYQPETNILMLKRGIMGYLTYINGQVSIKIDKSIESGKLLITKEV